MAGLVNLKPEYGTELASTLVQITDGQTLDTIQELYNACMALGDNNLSEGMRAKFMSIQDTYNSLVVPAVNKVKQSLEEYTDFATYVKGLSVDSKAAEVDIGTHAGNNYDAAMQL